MFTAAQQLSGCLFFSFFFNKFYAPWCGHCKKLEPIWNEVGLEMKNIGSPVKVGKMDATSYSSKYFPSLLFHCSHNENVFIMQSIIHSRRKKYNLLLM